MLDFRVERHRHLLGVQKCVACSLSSPPLRWLHCGAALLQLPISLTSGPRRRSEATARRAEVMSHLLDVPMSGALKQPTPSSYHFYSPPKSLDRDSDSTGDLLRIPGGHLVHLARKLFRSQDSLLKENVRKRRYPALVVALSAVNLTAEVLDSPTLLLGVDDLVKIQNIRQRVTALFPGLEHMVNLLDGLTGQSTNVVGQPREQFRGLIHFRDLAVSIVAGTTPIIASRVTSAASCS